MKKVVFGSAVLLAGILSIVLIITAPVGYNWTINGELSAWWIVSQYGLAPVVYALIAVSVIGLAIALIGIFEKDK